MSAKSLSSRAIIGHFFATLDADPGIAWVNDLSFYVKSDQESETYGWLGQAPAMREWVGGRQAKGFRENGITIINKEFEATTEVLVSELRRDKSGQVLVRIAEMAVRANTHWASLISTLLSNAAAGVCYDGLYFFDTTHSEGDSGTQSNLLSVDISALAASVHGSTTAPSVEEMQLCILAAVQAILGFKDDQGEPMNESASTFRVVVPTSLWAVAEAACKNPTLASGVTNLLTNLAGRLTLVPTINPRLTWTDRFAVFRTDGHVKPFIRQEEVPLAMDAVAEGSELEFRHKKHEYGVSATRNVGYGYWQHACQVVMI